MGKIYLRTNDQSWTLDIKNYNAHVITLKSGEAIEVSTFPPVNYREIILKKIEKIKDDQGLQRLNSILDRGGFLPFAASEEEFNSRDC